MIKTNIKIIDELLSRGVEEIIIMDRLKKRLLSGESLRIKFGIDPTAPDLHLGHSVPLRKLKQFQEAGHKIILIIGDFTATIGDPSGRTEARKPITPKDVQNNLKKYLKQAQKIINLKKTEIHYNSQWFRAKNSLQKILELSMASTVQQILHRADFAKRIKENKGITMLEALYPLFQAYDSVMTRSDLEIGGTDQKFNLLMGTRVQRFYNQTEQDILTVPILEGLDGFKKMSKSYGNYISLDEKPEEMFGKIMALPDGLIVKYFKLCTDFSLDQIKKIESDLINKINPRDLKLNLAFEIVKIYHGPQKAEKARDFFVKTFQKKEIPEEILEIKTKKGQELSEILLKNNLVKSKSDFKRLVDEGAIFNLLNKEKIKNYHEQVFNNQTLKIGKKRFIKIKIETL